MTDSTFTDNTVTISGGGICWFAANGYLSGSKFINNIANSDGGGVAWGADAFNFTLIDCTFISNIANNRGGAVYGHITGSIINCTFVNSKWVKSNGIYANTNLNINGGNGMADIFVNGILSGTSIVVLNNETYYYPPNANINLPNKNKDNGY